MKITKVSPITGKLYTLDLPITFSQLMAWRQGQHVQDAFPHLSLPEREFLLSGIPPDEWDQTFGFSPEET